MIGATLLRCDYIVTAALSAVEGYHYVVQHLSSGLVLVLSIATILVIGVINWLGARSAGRAALHGGALQPSDLLAEARS